MLNKFIALAIIITFYATSSVAANGKVDRWYGGAGVYANRISLHNNYKSLIDTANSTYDKSGKAYQVFAGYQFSYNIGFEFGVSWFDKLEFKNATASAANGGGTLNGEIKAQSYAVKAMGFVPFSKTFETVGELSALLFKTKTSAYVTSGTVNSLEPYSFKQTNIAFRIGAGFKYNFTERFGIRTMLRHQFSGRSKVIKYSSNIGVEGSFLF